jgi:hypothetical protein
MQKHILTLIFLFAGIFTSVPKWDYYFDGSFGYIPATLGLTGHHGFSAGITHSSQVGLGLGFSGVRDDTRAANGLGLELRLPFDRWFLVKLQAGAIVSASTFDDSGNSTYTYLRKDSKPYYWRAIAAVRFARIFFAGFGIMQTGPISFKGENPQLVTPNWVSVSPIKTVMWQLGISLPLLPKKKKENQ